ncbi:glycosyltransferase family 4 protein [Cellulomonas hominis]|uniref:glycosyltransferase family 4 protein n=1 Tax=Cellulomonas hominis TaxID=156981 RepID=UPI001BA32DE3|nr:glycosyltransferase family 4 protein [Cellulomonas hominis]VTR77799.1 N-acetylgalactosamine-N, N'-diacetylbacillosaminyl-diphospho-undecaprenol 4-alpha-N-acetylgalactosaminyltransferase [Cellulomonas hominis]
MRVLQVLGSSAGGVARHVAQVAAGLAAQGDHVVVAGPSSLAAVVAPGGSGVRFEPVEVADRPHASDARAVARIAALARDADAVHAHGLRAGALTVLAVRSRPGRRARVVVTLHNLPVGGRAIRAVSTVLGQVVARGSDVVLGVSGDLVTLARSQGARAAHRALVPAPGRPAPAGDRDATRAALGLQPHDDLVVTVARLAPQKGLDTLVSAAAEAVRVRPRLHWVVAGDGPLLDEVTDQAARAGAPVRLLGRREDVTDLMAAADVVASAAVWEGQPLALQEALALGAAVVATDAGGTREVTGDAAVLVPVGDAAALGTAVAEVLADEPRRTSLRAAATARAATLPTVPDVLAQLREAYTR